MASAQKNNLRQCLDMLRLQSGSSQNYRANVELLLTIYKNILSNPSEAKYKRIAFNKAHDKIWARAPVLRELMLCTGWVDAETEIVFADDTSQLRSVIEELAAARTDTVPEQSEWVAQNKVENVHYTGEDDREAGLRREAALRRDREYAACLDDKAQRQRIAETVRQEIQSDVRHRASLGPKITPKKPTTKQ